MSFHKCKTCDGTGKLNMHGRMEEASICCEGGGTYVCDECSTPVDPSDDGFISEPNDVHYCADCKRVCDSCSEPLDLEDFDGSYATCKMCTQDQEEEGRCAEMDHQRDCDHYGRDNC